MTGTNARSTPTPPRRRTAGFLAAGDPKRTARLVIGALLVLNLLAALFLLEPFGGSPEGLDAARGRMESQLQQQRLRLRQAKLLAGKMQSGGTEGERFIQAYFLDQRQAAGDLLKSLDAIESGSGIRSKGKNFTVDAIEGTVEYQLLTIDAAYEGTFADLVAFVNAVDRSDRLLILDSLQVTPARDELGLQVQAKMFAFVKQSKLVASAREVTP